VDILDDMGVGKLSAKVFFFFKVNYSFNVYCQRMYIYEIISVSIIYRGQQRLDFYFRTSLKGEEFVF